MPADILVRELTLCASALTGFSDEAILPEAIRRAAAQLLRNMSPAELLARAESGEHEVAHALCQAVSVGETYFFRHPEHFQFVARTVVPQLIARKTERIFAWSAGCATGEEPYSIAACLLDSLPADSTIRVEVLGTDLLSRNLAVAREGNYGAWSRRPAGPLLHPAFRPVPGAEGRVQVDSRVRDATRFAEHNLLDPMADGPFDLIFCRNVLVYFAPEAIRRTLAHISAALAPGGIAIFGSMDATVPPPGLERVSAPEEQIFRKPDPARDQKARPAAVASPPPSLLPFSAPRTPSARPPEPVALHLRALVHIERGEKVVAEKALLELSKAVPDYVPGILERALLHGRAGERGQASTLMREVLRRVEKMPEDDLIAGPEPLPVRFYRESAQNFLRGADR
jgi:chemotaxis methyl-accepting protein methylase